VSRTVVFVGAAGQLARDLARVWPEAHPDDRVIGLKHSDIQVENRESVHSALVPLEPQLVVNLAAYHRVDEIEDRPDRAFAVNTVGPRHLAMTCRELDAELLHFSTDYVFAGHQRRPYVESDAVEPLSVYGASKVAGEMLVRLTWPKHYIVRSCGLYGTAGSAGKGGNFVETMLRLGAAGAPIRVVDDQVVTPTATLPLARQVAQICRQQPHGTYHAVCHGWCSWYEFAAEIFRQAGVSADLKPQSTAESGAKAPRPPYSVLANANLERLGIDVMPDWRAALHAYLAERSAAGST